MLRHSLSLVSVALVAAALAPGCLVFVPGDDSKDTDPPLPAPPIGPVAENASEAWPTKPTVAPITREEIARACVAMTTCNPPEGAFAVWGVDHCAYQIEWAAERAIPMSNLMKGFERPEFLVRCLLEAADCTETSACFNGRDPAIYCEEDGCKVDADTSGARTCLNGTLATFHVDGREVTRDCSRAFAECDPDSPTGCTDRPFTACPGDGKGPDRCEGDILLGCDSKGQVSYHDCTRLGGTCGTLPDGKLGCDYGAPDPECVAEEPLFTTCSGGNASVCVQKQRITVPAPDLCPPA